jgi:hypothetical protein
MTASFDSGEATGSNGFIGNPSPKGPNKFACQMTAKMVKIR